MTQKTTASIPLEFVGESKAVKDLGGSLVKNYYEIEVECLPKDLVDHIDIDISKIETFDDVINLSDIKMPEGMEPQYEEDIVIATVSEPRVEEEPEAEEEKGEESEAEGKQEQSKEEKGEESEAEGKQK
jgi:large subunit ribosomal protein L25